MRVILRLPQMLKVRRQRVFCLSDLHDIINVNMKADIVISDVTFENVEGVSDFRSKEHVKIFRRYLAEGNCGVYAWIDSTVVGHAWANVCRQSHCRVNGYIDIDQGDAFLHYCNVRKDCRGQRIYRLMLVVLCQRLFLQEKVSRILIDTAINNRPSLRGIAKVGFKLVGTGIYIQFRNYLLFKHFTSFTRKVTAEAKKEIA
ncbi:MAG: GNAT family N-acetyltransferase [Candidatus Heimdallarchaeota archaeon]|nr:GNAT family N-acetyltransferase [Candidatus Heimdallarchaeota archaeon]